MTISVGIFLYDEVEVLDFAGPYEVFTTASRVSAQGDESRPFPFNVFTISKDKDEIRTRPGLMVKADYTISNHPPIDLLLVPGGVVTDELVNSRVTDWISGLSPRPKLTASVCTGAFLLAKSGLLDGKFATTHWEDVAEMRAMFPSVTVLEGRRWVDEGSMITSAGISAGIDMSLHLVERLVGRELEKIKDILICSLNEYKIRELMTSLPHVAFRISVRGSWVATCSGRFEVLGRTWSGEAGGAMTLHTICRFLY